MREQLATLKKIYCVDNGMVSSLIFDFSKNRGRFLENLVAVELRRRGYLEGFEVYYWDDYRVECDFVIKRGKRIVEAYQVCSALTIENREREIAGLMGAMRSFRLKRGVILTESLEEEVAQDGCRISVIPVWKWLIQAWWGASPASMPAPWRRTSAA